MWVNLLVLPQRRGSGASLIFVLLGICRSACLFMTCGHHWASGCLFALSGHCLVVTDPSRLQMLASRRHLLGGHTLRATVSCVICHMEQNYKASKRHKITAEIREGCWRLWICSHMCAEKQVLAQAVLCCGNKKESGIYKLIDWK